MKDKVVRIHGPSNEMLEFLEGMVADLRAGRVEFLAATYQLKGEARPVRYCLDVGGADIYRYIGVLEIMKHGMCSAGEVVGGDGGDGGGGEDGSA